MARKAQREEPRLVQFESHQLEAWVPNKGLIEARPVWEALEALEELVPLVARGRKAGELRREQFESHRALLTAACRETSGCIAAVPNRGLIEVRAVREVSEFVTG